MSTVLLIGAGGNMALEAALRVAAADPDIVFTFADYAQAGLDRLRARLGEAAARHRFARADLFDRAATAALAAGHDLLVNAAGPFYATTSAGIDAALAAGVDYVDISDDIEAAYLAFGRNAEVQDRNIRALIGCGASPGLTNVLVRELMDRMDEPADIETGFVTGDEGEAEFGDAVLEHTIQMALGSCMSWRDGRPTKIESYRRPGRLPLSGEAGRVTVYELAHPEVVTLPWHFPELRNVRILGGIHPPAVNGMLRGVAQAVETGALTKAQATGFLKSVLAGRSGTLGGWRAAWRGMRGQVTRGEMSGAVFWAFVRDALRNRKSPYVGGVAATCRGRIGNRQVTLARATLPTGPDHPFSSMAAVTGGMLATFIRAALDTKGGPAGVFAPEAWAAPDRIYALMGRYGLPPEETLGPVTVLEEK